MFDKTGISNFHPTFKLIVQSIPRFWYITDKLATAAWPEYMQIKIV